MRIINTASTLPTDALGQLAIYSGLDNLTLFEINNGLDALLTPEKRELYLFEMDLQSALLEMSLNGALVDSAERQRLTREHEKELAQVQAYLHEFCLAIGYYSYYIDQGVLRFSWVSGITPSSLPHSWDEWKALPLSWRRDIKQSFPGPLAEFHKTLKTFGPPYFPGSKKGGAFNGNSPKQKLRLLYDFFGHDKNSVHQEFSPEFACPYNQTRGISEIRTRNSKNEWKPAADRESLEKIQTHGWDNDRRDAHFWALPFIACCLDIADLAKTLGFLKCKLEDGYFKSSFGAVTETGRLASKENAQGYGSNAQNITPRLRVILTAEPGWKLAAPDYEQIESRIVGAICYQLFGATAYLNACESGDLHTLVVSLVWEDLPWPKDFTLSALAKHGPFPPDMIRASKSLAKEIFYREFSRRDLCKRLGHGSNYRGQPRHMAKQTHIDLPLVEHFQDTYFTVFPELLQWHRWVVQQVQTNGELTTFLGRTRRFFGRPTDDATIRKAIAYEPQSVAADYTNSALLKIYKAQASGLPIKLFLQKHDEIGFRFREADEDLTVPKVCDIMTSHRSLVSPDGSTRDWCVPVEAATGWNLAHASAQNPDGLVEYTGRDDRVRQSLPNQPSNVLKMKL